MSDIIDKLRAQLRRTDLDGEARVGISAATAEIERLRAASTVRYMGEVYTPAEAEQEFREILQSARVAGWDDTSDRDPADWMRAEIERLRAQLATPTIRTDSGAVIAALEAEAASLRAARDAALALCSDAISEVDRLRDRVAEPKAEGGLRLIGEVDDVRLTVQPSVDFAEVAPGSLSAPADDEGSIGTVTLSAGGLRVSAPARVRQPRVHPLLAEYATRARQCFDGEAIASEVKAWKAWTKWVDAGCPLFAEGDADTPLVPAGEET